MKTAGVLILQNCHIQTLVGLSIQAACDKPIHKVSKFFQHTDIIIKGFPFQHNTDLNLTGY